MIYPSLLRSFLISILLIIALCLPVPSAASDYVRGSNADTIIIPEGEDNPAVSTVPISYQGVVKIKGVKGAVHLTHNIPSTLVLFLDHPRYQEWEQRFRQDMGRAPTFDEMTESDLTLMLGEAGDPQYVSFDYVFPARRSFLLTGDWALRIYDTVADGFTGYLKGWSFSLEVSPENPPELMSWSPKDGSVIWGKEVHIDFAAEDPDGDPLIYNISFYDGENLLYEIDADHLVVDTTHGASPDGVYRIDYVALSMGDKLHNFDIVTCHVLVDNASHEGGKEPVGKAWPQMSRQRLAEARESYLAFLRNVDIERSAFLAFIPDDYARKKALEFLKKEAMGR